MSGARWRPGRPPNGAAGRDVQPRHRHGRRRRGGAGGPPGRGSAVVHRVDAGGCASGGSRRGTSPADPLELGGKSPAALLDDLDDASFEKALRRVMGGSFLNSGQMCSALTRVVVPARQLVVAEDVLADAAGGFVVGDPFDPATARSAGVRRPSPYGSRARRAGDLGRGAAGAWRCRGPDGLDTGYRGWPLGSGEVTRPGPRTAPGASERARSR